MASMNRMKVAADLHVSGNGVRAIALQESVKLHDQRVESVDQYAVESIFWLADQFVEYINRPVTFGGSDE